MCFNFDRSSRCTVSRSPPLSCGQSTDCTRVESLHKLKFLRSHRGAEKSRKWNAIRRREGTILARVQGKMKLEGIAMMITMVCALRIMKKLRAFLSFFFSSITLLHYFLIYSLKKRKLKVFERIKISFEESNWISPSNIPRIFTLLSLLKERAKNWRGKNIYRKFDWNLAYVLALWRGILLHTRSMQLHSSRRLRG